MANFHQRLWVKERGSHRLPMTAVGSYEARKSAPTERVEVTVRTERRRRWSNEEKLGIVRETLAPGAIAQVVADRHEIGTGLLYTWRKQMLTAAMTGFAAVEIAPEPAARQDKTGKRADILVQRDNGGPRLLGPDLATSVDESI